MWTQTKISMAAAATKKMVRIELELSESAIGLTRSFDQKLISTALVGRAPSSVMFGPSHVQAVP